LESTPLLKSLNLTNTLHSSSSSSSWLSDDFFSFLAHHCPSLEILCLEHNQLRRIGKTIRLMKELKELHLSFNELTVLPHGLFQLTQLTLLSINENKFKSIWNEKGKDEDLREGNGRKRKREEEEEGEEEEFS